MKIKNGIKKIIGLMICVVVVVTSLPWSNAFAETNSTSQESTESVSEENYTELTFFDYGIADGAIAIGGGSNANSYGQIRVDTTNLIPNLDDVAFTGKVMIGDDSSATHYLNGVRVGFGGSSGIGISRSGTDLIFYDYINLVSSMPTEIARVSASTLDVNLDQDAVTVRFAFQYVTDTSDIDYTISVNNTWSVTETFTNGQNTLGKGVGVLVWPNTAAITVESVEPTMNELTFADYNLANDTTSVGNQTYGTTSVITSLDGVAFTGKVILEDSKDNVQHWNAVRVGVGTGAEQGGIGIFRSGASIFFSNYTNDGVTHLKEVTNTQHGVDDLDITAVTVRFAFEYIKNTTNVKVTFSLNGTRYYNDILTDGQSLLGLRTLIWARTAPITVESVGTDLFKELTFSDFGITNGTTTADIDNQIYGKTSKTTNMDKVAFSGRVILGNSAELPHWNAVRVGVGYDEEQGGIGVFRSGTNIILYNYTNNEVQGFGQVTQTQHGVTDLDNTAVTIRFTFEYVENSTDVIFTFSLNGTQYFKETLADGQKLLGTRMLIWARTAPITVQSTGMEVFKELTFSDYGIDDGKTEVGTATGGTQKVGMATMITNLDGVAFTGNILLEDSTDRPDLNGVRVGYGSATGQGGIGVCRSGSNIILYNFTNNTQKGFGQVTQSQHGVADLDTTEVKIRFTFKYVKNSSDVIFTFSINGNQYFEETITDGQMLLGNQMLVWARTATVTVKSVVPKQVMQEDIYHDLRMGEYQIVYEGLFSINDESKQLKENLADTGIYNVAYRTEKATYIQDVIAYRLGQIHADGQENDVRALVKALKAEKDSQADRYVTKAADFNKNDFVDDADLEHLRELLIKENDNVWEGDVMPIAGYYGPIASYTSDEYGYTSKDFLQNEYFKLIADCGVNLITRIDCDYNTSPQNVIQTLEFCEQQGIRMFVTDSGLKSDMSEIEMEEQMKVYSGYQSFAGVFVVDEPETNYFPTISNEVERALSTYQGLASKINRFDNLLGYVNLYPYYSWMETEYSSTIEDYQKYINEYCQTYHPTKVLSFDHYPFDARDYKTYFTNMSVIREKATELDIPYWPIVQSGGQFSRVGQASIENYPLEGEFYWNVNTCLAMGAKGIQYFPLVQPHWMALTSNGLDTSRSGLIGADGITTVWYDYATNINEQIQKIDEVLMNAEHEGIIAKGNAATYTADVECLITNGSFRELTGVTTQNAGAVIGCFDYQGKTALYVVNNDMSQAQTITLALSGNYTIKQISGDGTQTMSASSYTATLQKGEAVLLVIE